MSDEHDEGFTDEQLLRFSQAEDRPFHPVGRMSPIFCGVCGAPMTLVDGLNPQNPFAPVKLWCEPCNVTTSAPVLQRVPRTVGVH